MYSDEAYIREFNKSYGDPKRVEHSSLNSNFYFSNQQDARHIIQVILDNCPAAQYYSLEIQPFDKHVGDFKPGFYISFTK